MDLSYLFVLKYNCCKIKYHLRLIAGGCVNANREYSAGK